MDWFESLLHLSSRVKRTVLPNLSTTPVSRASVRKNRETEGKKRASKSDGQRERERERMRDIEGR